jgi:hypothetical protein
MQIPKDQILQLLRDRGDNEQADKAAQHLPDTVDTDQHGGLLAQHGINVEDLLTKFGGGLGNLI